MQDPNFQVCTQHSAQGKRGALKSPREKRLSLVLAVLAASPEGRKACGIKGSIERPRGSVEGVFGLFIRDETSSIVRNM